MDEEVGETGSSMSVSIGLVVVSVSSWVMILCKRVGPNVGSRYNHD